jgi:hypothetical protein
LDLNVPDHIHFSNIVLLVVIVLLLRPQLRRWWRRLREHWRDHQPRRWKPQSPDDCPRCRSDVCLSIVKPGPVTPYPQTKSPLAGCGWRLTRSARSSPSSCLSRSYSSIVHSRI